jgi:Contractile injection system tube protein
MPIPKHYPENYVKAMLQVEGGSPINALFNPTEFTISKGNDWKFDPIKGTSFPKGKFGGGKPREMQVSLLFDQSLPNGDKSVKQITDELFMMMEVPSGTGGGNADAAPPLVTFQWGVMIPFKAACTSLTVAYQLFQPNGEPIRAEVKLALTQAAPASTASAPSPNTPTNPTTRSDGGKGIHMVRDGDSLQSIAHQVYGDPNHWRLVAEVNGIDNPLHLRRGTALNLPRLD